jgi:hypothetical protein
VFRETSIRRVSCSWAIGRKEFSENREVPIPIQFEERKPWFTNALISPKYSIAFRIMWRPMSAGIQLPIATTFDRFSEGVAF